LAISTVFDFRFAESLGCRPSAISASDLALQFIPVFMRTPMHSESVVPQRDLARALYSSAPHPLFFKAIQI
jgi:hypothetical protein